ncbi:MAG: hypothetical protein IJ026_00495 [Candidatus Methanomethylophilaceae archaeon]|nr:hypothetical protein [Candidatus Methanomethylophilaceae archaeon]
MVTNSSEGASAFGDHREVVSPHRIGGESKVQEFLRTFRCSRDSDLGTFLHDRAIFYEKKGRARTYLIVDSDDEHDTIVAYIPLAITHLTVCEDTPLSKTIRKRMDLHDNMTDAYLIGQLAKDDRVEERMGHELIRVAINLIRPGFEMFGCRTIRIDCKEPLLKFYEREGFFRISTEPVDGLYRMVCLI